MMMSTYQNSISLEDIYMVTNLLRASLTYRH